MPTCNAAPAAAPGAPRLFSLVSYPVACEGGQQKLSGEVYRVTRHTLRQLDALEECPHVYTRKRLTTPWGPAWIYLQRNPPGSAIALPAGNWRHRTLTVLKRHGFEPVAACQPFGVDASPE